MSRFLIWLGFTFIWFFTMGVVFDWYQYDALLNFPDYARVAGPLHALDLLLTLFGPPIFIGCLLYADLQVWKKKQQQDV